MKNYKNTIKASYLGYITQAAVNCLPPLLFLTFAKNYGVSLLQLGLTTTVNFGTQLLFDFITPFWVKWKGVRHVTVAAHVSATLGLLCFGFLPELAPENLAYVAILFCMILCGIGGGVTEVLISPIVESCPSETKARAMGLLHSMYSFGCVIVAVTTAAYFGIMEWSGSHFWQLLPILWCLLPLFNAFFFARVPLNEQAILGENTETTRSEGERQSRRVPATFLFVLLCMTGAGASEMAMSQWISSFMEAGLHFEKAVGDLVGPCLFALFMGISRVVYARFADKVKLSALLALYAFGMLGCYVLVGFGGYTGALVGCVLAGFFVGPLWPATFSLEARLDKGLGTGLYAAMAFAGDVGCSLGPAFVGFVADRSTDGLHAGLKYAAFIPCLVILGALCLLRKEHSRKSS